MTKRTPLSVFSLFIILIFALAGCKEQQDPPNAVKLKVNPITQTDYDDGEKNVYPLTLEFTEPAAPLEQLQKEVTQGISFTPELKGKWQWTNDRTLTFTPADDWPTGQQYQLKLDQKILNPKFQYAKAVTEPQSVETPKFNATIGEQEFYQDPAQAHIRQSIVRITFSHPVDPQKLEKAVTVNLIRKNVDNTQDTIAPLKFKIRYDDNRLNAWISSDNVNLANTDQQYIQSKIDKNVTALIGGNALNEALNADVAVPTKFSLNLHGNIIYVNNDQNESEQLLSFNFNRQVKGSDIDKNIRIFLLPQQDQAWTYSNITQQVLGNSLEITHTLIPTEQVYSQVQNFRINVPQQRCIYAYIDNKFNALGGYQFQQPQGVLNCAGNYPQYVNFVGEGSLLTLKGDKKITIAARNFDKVQLDIGRVQGEQLRHIAHFNHNSFQQPNLGNLKFDDIASFSTQQFLLPNVNPAKPDYVSFDLSSLSKTGNRGIFWLKATGLQNNENIHYATNKDNAHEYNWRNQNGNKVDDYRLVVLTDLGIIAKKANDGSQSVFVQSIHSGQPVANAGVKVIGRNGATVVSAITDASGMALIPTLENYKQELEPVMYLVEHQGDQSFLPINKQDRTLDYSRFDVGGEYSAQDNSRLKAYLFNDRGIYRPDEPLHIGIVTKAADWQTKLSNVPLQLELTTPNGYLATKKTIHLNANGFNSFNYHLPENAESGEWMANLYIVSQDQQTEIGSMTFQVQEFQPDTLKIKTSFNSGLDVGWVTPQDLTATVHLANLFGTPAQNRKVTANLALHSIFPKFKQYEDYQFYDNQRNKDAVLYETELNEQYTNEKGETAFQLDLTRYAENTVQMLYFFADGFETNSGRGVSTVKSVLVSAQPWLVGYQSKQDLNYVKEAGDNKIHLIAVNPKLEKTAVSNLTATLFERKYVSVLTQQDSGAYKYESKLVETQKSESAVNIPQEGLDFALNTKNSGDFVLVLTNEHNQEVNRINYSVIGNKNLSSEMAKNTELKLKLNKKQFQPGEEIEVVINAPYAGSGLITIERDRVYAHQWFKADTNQSVQRIRLPEGFEGNGYINVQFSRDINSSEIFTSPLSYGVAPFTVNVDNRRLTLQLEAPKQVKSGEIVEFKLTSDKPGKAVIYAVNEGILQVAGYKLKDPLQFFFPKYALQVNTLQILDLILPEFSKIMLFAQTGGGEDYLKEEMMRAMAAASNNPFKRKADKPVAYWSDIITIDGEKIVTYRIPEGFNGNLRVMALAVSDDNENIGTAETDTLVQDDLILSSTVPLTLTPSDQSLVSVTVANNTNRTQQVKLKLTPEAQLSVVGESEKTVEIAAKQESAVDFEIKATEQVGATNLQLVAIYQNDQQQATEVVRNLSLSVRPTQPKQYFNQIGKVEQGKQQNIALPAALYPQQRQQTAAFSPAPLLLTQGISVYLSNYDNYCTEQIISSAMPNILFAGNPEYQQILTALSRGGDHKDPLIATQALKKVFSLLSSRQTENGAFGVWSNVTDTDPFVTAYVAHFLIEAQEHQMRLPRAWTEEYGLFPRAVSALEQQSIPQEGDSLAALRQRAYSAYLLTRLAQVPTNALHSIQTQLEQNFKAQDWQTDLVSAWLAAAYQNLKQDDKATALITPLLTQSVKPRTEKWRYDYYSDPLIQDSSTLYVVARHFPEKLANIAEPVLNRITEDLNAERYNTLSSAMLLLALDAYAQQYQGNGEQLQILLNGNAIGELQGAFRLADINDESANLTFANQSGQSAWFALSQSGYPKQAPTQNLKNGLEIDRTYTDKDGKEVKSVKIGDTVNVTVKVRSSSDYLSNVVITDLFPAGFEAVWSEETEVEGDDIWAPQHTDLREDRMLSYGDVTNETRYLKYKLKAVNIGTYQIPSVYAESMYDRSIKALAVGNGQLKVEK